MKTVRSRIFFLILALCLIASGLVIFQYRTQNRMIDRYVRNVMDERVDRARSLLSINDDFYRSITNDYTYWDEMIGFIHKPDYPWAADNIRNIIEAYHANAVWIYRLNGIRIYSAADPEQRHPELRSSYTGTEGQASPGKTDPVLHPYLRGDHGCQCGDCSSDE